MKTLDDIKKSFKDLPGMVQEELLEELLRDFENRGQVLDNAIDELKKARKNKPCPHCNSRVVYKRGKQNGVQMYQCRTCNKWYSETTGTPLWDIKLKNKWQGFLRCFEKGMTIKQISVELEISIQTSFDWRHKLLSSLNSLVPNKLGHVVECDELELSLSKKGSRSLGRKPRKRANDFVRNDSSEESTVVQVVTAVERNGDKYLRAVESKRLSAKEISKAFEGKLEEETVLITDKHPSYKLFIKEHKTLKHKTVLAKDHVNKEDRNIHLQKVNNIHSQLRDFLKPFKGVSSKYLQNYLNWFAHADKLAGTKTVIKQWFLNILRDASAYALFKEFKDNAVLIRI